MGLNEFLVDLEYASAVQMHSSSETVVIESFYDDGYWDVTGPFKKDTAEVFEADARLRAQPGCVATTIKTLFPPSSVPIAPSAPPSLVETRRCHGLVGDRDTGRGPKDAA